MRDPIILLVHLIATLARLMGPGGLRSVVAESLLVKHQLLILNRSRHRGCLRRSLLIGQLHPYNRGGHEESHPPVHLSHEPDRWDGVRYLRV